MRRFYTTFEAAQVLGVSLPTVVNWITARRIKAHRTPGGHRRIAREDLAAFMLRHGIPVPEELADAAPGRRKVLVICDEGPGREGSVRPHAAAGGAAARFKPDVIVLHARAPDGGEELRELRADREVGSVPVVAVGHLDWQEALEGAGCEAVLARPLGADDLAGAVAGALRSGALRAGGTPRDRQPSGARPAGRARPD